MQRFNCFALGMLQKLVLYNAYADSSNRDLSTEFESALKRTHMNLTESTDLRPNISLLNNINEGRMHS